jgi:hypothetical protein
MTLPRLKIPRWLLLMLGLTFLLNVLLLLLVLPRDRPTILNDRHGVDDRPDDVSRLGEPWAVEVDAKPLIIDGRR